jgi:hypothetical protein
MFMSRVSSAGLQPPSAAGSSSAAAAAAARRVDPRLHAVSAQVLSRGPHWPTR